MQVFLTEIFFPQIAQISTELFISPAENAEDAEKILLNTVLIHAICERKELQLGYTVWFKLVHLNYIGSSK